MNSSQQWINIVKQQTKGKNFWRFNTQDISGKKIVFQWCMADILSPILATFKKEVADLAARVTALSEVEFLRQNPEAVHQEIFLKSCVPLFVHGFNNVDWDTVEKTLQITIKKFYSTDILTFGEQVIKVLSNDIYFFARVEEQDTENLLGFCMFAITPNLTYGDIKLIDISLEPREQRKGIEKQLLESLFAIIKPHRIFTAVRSTNTNAQKLFKTCGFVVDTNSQQDLNHMLNLNYFTVMDYKVNNI